MGVGDEIMAAGRAEAIYASGGRPVAILDRHGQARRHPVWDGNPAIDPQSSARIVDGPGARPYIRRWNGRQVHFEHAHRPRAGHLYLTPQERAFADALGLPGRFAVVEPVVQRPSSPNKDWGFRRWQEVVAALASELPVVQLGPDDGRAALCGARRVVTPDFRRAAAVIERAALVLCTEGGTHHMAAALGRPAVVIFGAFTPPDLTGYPGHINLAVETPQGYCGNYQPCEHCTRAMAAIAPRTVIEAALALLTSTT